MKSIIQRLRKHIKHQYLYLYYRTSADDSRWKNEFLKQIEHGYEIEIKSIFEDERYRLFGLPLFNERENYRDFGKKFDDILCHNINRVTS